MTVVPDTKDWTWVLERPCPECGLDTQSFAREAVAGMIRANAQQWQDVLTGTGEVRHRPAPGTWSALEYGCHVRDVLRLYDERLVLMLHVNGPSYPNWDQDATAIADRYAEQDPVLVAAGLREAAGVLAARFETVSGDQWLRTGFRGDGARFTVESFARYFIHDPIHHLHDITGEPGPGHGARRPDPHPSAGCRLLSAQGPLTCLFAAARSMSRSSKLSLLFDLVKALTRSSIIFSPSTRGIPLLRSSASSRIVMCVKYRVLR